MTLRSWMFVPADSEKMLAKSSGIKADALVFDLEDAVVPSRKVVARDMLLAHLLAADRSTTNAQHWVRINALDTPYWQDDLRCVMAARPQGVVLPKAEHAHHADHLSEQLDELERVHGIELGTTRLALIAFETPLAVLNAASYQKLNKRVLGMSWGAEDMAAALGATANRDAQGAYTPPYVMARNMCLMAASAAGVQAIDTPFTDFRDADGLVASCRDARRDGFLGKIAIHPAQLEAIHAAFTPNEEELVHARAIVAAFAANPGAGTVGLNGKMLDRPHLIQAQKLLS